jgi:hypothetical protein
VKRFVFSFLCLFLLFGCSKPLYVESVKPDFLFGKWVASLSSAPGEDAVIEFLSSGRYSYSVSRQIDSLSRDTSYWERGVWNVTFIDLDHDKTYDNDAEENHLFTDADASSVPANVGRGTYSLFKYSASGGRESLELSADSGVVIGVFVKDTIQ